MKKDVFRDALVAALAEQLDVEADRLALTITLDGDPVPASNLPATLELDGVEEHVVAPPEAADDATRADERADETDETDEAPAEDERPRRANGRDAARASRGSADEADGGDVRGGRSDGAPRESVTVSAEEIDEEAEAAADLLEGLLDAMDLPGDLRISVQEAHAEVEVIGLEEGVLIGRRGQTLEAVQELVRTAMQRRFERRSRVLVDVDGYRARRLEKLLERADEAVAEVLESGEAQRLEPMDSIERRLVHQRVAETEGVVSNSHGREPSRRIVIELAD